ncbi:MAG: AAC(3) family N-acetyltransferase [Halioglobus sp.]|nr:AAC(3) family N-acetyltransferase [Halioglobus sp.]
MSFVESVSSALLRILPSDYFLKVRNAYLKSKKLAAPALRFLHGSFSTPDLIAEIAGRIDSDWEILMVHSSVNNLSPTYNGDAGELLRALIKFVGPQRTLVMPVFNFGEFGEGARDMLQCNPRFDLRRAPSQMGLLTELFRRSRGVVQSRHPVYRIAALGPRADELIAGHENAPSGMGKNTPFDYMARHNAQILGIGKSFQVMTQVHHVESLLGSRWPAPTVELPEIEVTVVLDKTRDIRMRLGGVQQQWRFNVWKLRELMTPEELREWRFHGCPMFAARAAAVTSQLEKAAENGFTLYDP